MNEREGMYPLLPSCLELVLARERGRIEGGSRGPSWKSIERRKKPEEQEEESRPVRKERKKALSPLTAIHRNAGYPTGVVVRKPRKN